MHRLTVAFNFLFRYFESVPIEFELGFLNRAVQVQNGDN